MAPEIPPDECTCENCAWRLGYSNGKGERIYAECHRFPPADNGFPRVSEVQEPWCGEWKAREQK